MRNEKPAFCAVFGVVRAAIPCPRGERAVTFRPGLPSCRFEVTKKSLADCSEKLKNLRKTKKTRPESGVVGEGSPLGEGWSDGGDPSNLTDRNGAGCNGTVADLEPRKRAKDAGRILENCNRIDTNCNGRGKKRCTVAIL